MVKFSAIKGSVLYFVVIAAILSFSNLSNAQEHSLYVFATEVDQQTIAITILDTETMAISTSFDIVKTFPSSSNSFFLSPNMNWLAIVPTGLSPSSRELIIVDVWSQHLTSIPANINSSFLYSYEENLLAPSSILAWSPDSNYIAFIDEAENEQSIRIYSVNDDSVSTIARDAIEYANLAWSSDSTVLAYTTSYCDTECHPWIEVALADDGTIISRTQFDDSLTTFLPEFICNLNWSPDSYIISFMSVCGPRQWQDSKEIYIFDTRSSEITQVTNLTSVALPMTDPPNPDLVGRFATYNTYWVSQTQLLIGASYSKDYASNRVYETFLYETNPDRLSKVSEFSTVEYAAQNSGGLYAFIATFTDGVVGELRIGNIENSLNLGTEISFSAGCSLDWHPDNSVLAYIIGVEDDECPQHTQQLAFVKIESSLAFEESLFTGERIIPIGWLHTNNSLPSPTPTSTPTPTITPSPTVTLTP